MHPSLTLTAGADTQYENTGQDSNLTVQGSTITAGNNAKLLADNEIQLLAAKNDYTQTSSNSSSTVTQNANGTYTAQIDVFDPTKVNAQTGVVGTWVEKVSNKGESTFFNPSWSQARIEYEVSQAFKAGRIDTPIGRSFIGTTPSGIKIQFHSDSVRTTFYPTGL